MDFKNKSAGREVGVVASPWGEVRKCMAEGERGSQESNVEEINSDMRKRESKRTEKDGQENPNVTNGPS